MMPDGRADRQFERAPDSAPRFRRVVAERFDVSFHADFVFCCDSLEPPREGQLG